jgi:serine/threonine-protein kinase
MRISLIVLAGPHKGRVFRFEGHDTFLVGRSRRAHFQLPPKDDYYSRFHFLIEVNPPACRLLDLGSENGTWVNGEKVAVADLEARDRIQVGRTIFQVHIQEPPGAKATTPRDRSAQSPALKKPTPAPTKPPVVQRSEVDDGPLPSPSQLRQVDVLPGQCAVCEGPLTVAHPGPSADAVQPNLSTLCLACQEEIRNHPQPFANYQIIRELGRGALGVVYLALRRNDGNCVALKTILPRGIAGKPQVEQFLREATSLRELNQQHLVSLRQTGESAGRVYCILDYVRGTSAPRLLDRYGLVPWRRAVNLSCELLEALEYAHGQGCVHGDIKPGNVLLTEPDGGKAMLTDFGLARKYQASPLSGLTLMGEDVSPFAFLAPERILRFRETRPTVDQYGVAATLYYLLTGKCVYDLPAGVVPCLRTLLEAEGVPIQVHRADVPAGLAEVLHRGLARQPSTRFADVTEMRKALVACTV